MSVTDQPPSSGQAPDRFSIGDDAVLDALAGVVRALRAYAVSHPELRAQLAVLGKALLEIAESPPVVAIQEIAAERENLVDPAALLNQVSESPESPSLPAPKPPVAPFSPPASHEDLQRLIRVMTGLEPRPIEAENVRSELGTTPAPAAATDDSVDLQILASHCALKAEVAHWCGSRTTADQAAKLSEVLAARARAMPECKLWMLRSDMTSAIAPAYGPMLAGCFQAMAEVAELILAMEAQAFTSAMVQNILQLAAEVQSALRVALSVVQPSIRDADQEALFQWVRLRAERDQIYIPRYMRKTDCADWEGWAERLERIRALSATINHRMQQRRRERKLLGRLRHQLQVGLPTASDAAAVEALWRRVDEVLSALVTNGMPPSNKNLRTLLTPRLALLPPTLSLSPQAQLVLRTVSEYHAAHSSLATEQEEVEVVVDPSLSAVADLLRDRTVVFIGGDRRPYIADAIEEAFGLDELVWCSTQEGQGYLAMHPYIARPEVCLVLLAIRWASHNLSEVSIFCERYNKPLVRLPAGYNVSQIAHQVLQQAGERLREATT